MAFALLCSLLAAAPGPHQTPWFLPRYAALQAMFRPGVVVPTLRVGWEIDLIDQPRNTLVFTLEGGAGLGAANRGAGLVYNALGLFGLGYRSLRESGLTWGFNIGFGPAFYGLKAEQRVSPYIEARVHAGAKLKGLTLALCGGYGQWVTFVPQSEAQLYLGGPYLGILLGWK
jgi:hypothetical protein